MRKRLFAALCLLGAGLLAQTSVHQLRDVKKIYVGTFGNALGSDVIRSKVIAHLVNSHRLEVVENDEQADAILTGDSQVAGEPGKKGYHATAGVRLLAKDSKILWADDTSNGAFARSATSSIADQISKRLLKAIAEDEKSK